MEKKMRVSWNGWSCSEVPEAFAQHVRKIFLPYNKSCIIKKKKNN